MTRVRVKICGLTRAEDAALAVSLGADAVGFVFWPQSPRAIAVADAAAISRTLPPFVTRVGVFVNASPEEVAAAVREACLDAAQLHGDESVLRYQSAAPRLIKAVAPDNVDDLAAAAALPSDVTVLVDTLDRDRRGGTGRTADWKRAAELARVRPIVLAGGLNAVNLSTALGEVRPWAVDVSSGVEESPGVKSAARLRELFAAVRNWELS